MEPPKKIRKLRSPSLEYEYAVLSKETTKDWKKDTVLEKTFDNLQSAVDHVNRMILDYIEEYCLEDEFGDKIPTVSVADIPADAFKWGHPFQIINVKSPEDEFDDPDEDGMWGNLRIFIQQMKKTN